MGTISFQVIETGQTTATKSYTVADANIDRLVTAYQTAANGSIGGTATRAQVLNFWVQGIVNETITYVANYEQAAALAAVAPVTQIIFT